MFDFISNQKQIVENLETIAIFEIELAKTYSKVVQWEKT